MSSLVTERAYLIDKIGGLATRAVAEINPAISCIRQKQFPIPSGLIKEVWKGRMNLSGVAEPPIADPAKLTVTEINLARFLCTREHLPMVTVVELELEPTGFAYSLSRYWNYGVRMGFAGDPQYLMHGIGQREPKALGGLDMIIKPVIESQLHTPISVADLRAFRDLLQYAQAS